MAGIKKQMKDKRRQQAVSRTMAAVPELRRMDAEAEARANAKRRASAVSGFALQDAAIAGALAAEALSDASPDVARGRGVTGRAARMAAEKRAAEKRGRS